MRIWLTPTGGWRNQILRMYWDDDPQPAVECPVGDTREIERRRERVDRGRGDWARRVLEELGPEADVAIQFAAEGETGQSELSRFGCRAWRA